jgi:tRNA(Ile)-lysidine synthase TilS/MesJ
MIDKSIVNIANLSRKTIEQFDLIKSGDKIGIGVSGGKDSMLLVHILYTLKEMRIYDFEFEVFHIDNGYKNNNIYKMKEYFESISIKFNVIETNIHEIIFNIKKESNPCSLCSRMRRGALLETLYKSNFNKLALGHHYEDQVNTFFMNLLYTGKIDSFKTKTFFENKNITMIRPLSNISERTIKNAILKAKIPTFESLCPVDKKTSRTDIDYFVKEIYKKYPKSRDSINSAMKSIDKR